MSSYVIDSERLRHIPAELRGQHEFCIWLHDRMVDVIRQAELYRIAEVTLSFKDENERKAIETSGNVIAYCLDNGRFDDAKRITMNQIVVPLYSDLAHFVYEGLLALEKRKYTVAFALLRKPLKYSLMFATWIFADEADFFYRLRRSPAKLLSERDNLKEPRRRELLNKAIATLPFHEFVDASVLHAIIYDRSNPKGLAPYFDMANHLVTSASGIQTEELNLNFIFKNPNDTDIYEVVYFPVAYLLTYLILLQLETIGRMCDVSESYRDWLLASIFGTFGAIFEQGDSSVVDQMNLAVKTMLRCSVCDSQMAVTNDNAARFFLTELIECPECGTEQQFPLFWLMTQRHEFSKSVEKTPSAN